MGRGSSALAHAAPAARAKGHGRPQGWERLGRKKGTGKNPPLLQRQRAGKALGCREEQGWGPQPTSLSRCRIKLLISQKAKIPRPGSAHQLSRSRCSPALCNSKSGGFFLFSFPPSRINLLSLNPLPALPGTAPHCRPLAFLPPGGTLAAGTRGRPCRLAQAVPLVTARADPEPSGIARRWEGCGQTEGTARACYPSPWAPTQHNPPAHHGTQGPVRCPRGTGRLPKSSPGKRFGAGSILPAGTGVKALSWAQQPRGPTAQAALSPGQRRSHVGACSCHAPPTSSAGKTKRLRCSETASSGQALPLPTRLPGDFSSPGQV